MSILISSLTARIREHRLPLIVGLCAAAILATGLAIGYFWGRQAEAPQVIIYPDGPVAQ